jgi:hypothetical protein
VACAEENSSGPLRGPGAGSGEQAIGPGGRLPGKKVSYFFSSFFSLFAYLPKPFQIEFQIQIKIK